MLSSLYAGDKLVALHLGMRSGTTFHYWFPAYNPQYSKYSPGFMLLMHLIQESAEKGIRMIDLGAGDEQYKLWIRNDTVLIGRGSFERPCLKVFLRQLKRRTKDLFRKIPFLFNLLRKLKSLFG